MKYLISLMLLVCSANAMALSCTTIEITDGIYTTDCY